MKHSYVPGESWQKETPNTGVGAKSQPQTKTEDLAHAMNVYLHEPGRKAKRNASGLICTKTNVYQLGLSSLITLKGSAYFRPEGWLFPF